ncbi:hypothetical protein ACP0HM_15875 [Escherichia coli]
MDMTELRRRIDQKILRRSRTGNGTDRADKNFRYGEDEK